jgi:hypothetical protein
MKEEELSESDKDYSNSKSTKLQAFEEFFAKKIKISQ